MADDSNGMSPCKVTIKIDERYVLLCFLVSQLQYQLALAKSIELLEAVKEIGVLEQDSDSWLAPSLKHMLENEERLRREFKHRTRALAFIIGIICDLFVDWYKLQLGGQDVRHKIPELEMFLTSEYSYQGLCQLWFGLEV